MRMKARSIPASKKEEKSPAVRETNKVQETKIKKKKIRENIPTFNRHNSETRGKLPEKKQRKKGIDENTLSSTTMDKPIWGKHHPKGFVERGKLEKSLLFGEREEVKVGSPEISLG